MIKDLGKSHKDFKALSSQKPLVLCKTEDPAQKNFSKENNIHLTAGRVVSDLALHL